MEIISSIGEGPRIGRFNKISVRLRQDGILCMYVQSFSTRNAEWSFPNVCEETSSFCAYGSPW
ncbi:hypothetical protein M513_11801 [Trichuris suis]|uniref:Uncharacterized protein n=1 Tax=Trichuris suis TaxID=68888 RepID=A0A085LQU7_9BILA|nr:hypothetical protein M513_11801 [Trichuris suis]